MATTEMVMDALAPKRFVSMSIEKKLSHDISIPQSRASHGMPVAISLLANRFISTTESTNIITTDVGACLKSNLHDLNTLHTSSFNYYKPGVLGQAYSLVSL